MNRTTVITFLTLALALFFLVSVSYSADPLGTKMSKKFCNNMVQDAYDLTVVFNGPVLVPWGVTGDYSPFTSVTNGVTSDTVKFDDPTIPLASGKCTGCITFKSGTNNLQILNAFWTDEDSNKIADLNLTTDVKPCNPAPSLSFWGLFVLTILIITSGLWLIRKRIATV